MIFLIFFEDLDLSSLNILMPSIIVLDDCLSAGTITQNINVIKTQFNAPIIYLTVAHARQADQDQIILACDDFILKPFTPEELKDPHAMRNTALWRENASSV